MSGRVSPARKIRLIMELRAVGHHRHARAGRDRARSPREPFVPPPFPDTPTRTRAADRLRPDHQPAAGRRRHDPGARARSPRRRCSRSAPARATRPPCCRGWRAASTRSSATSRCSKEAEARFCRARASTTSSSDVGDGSKGWPEQAPFDRIIVTAAADEVPQTLHRPARRRRHPGGAGRPRSRRPGARCASPDAKRVRSATAVPVRFVPLVAGALPRTTSAAARAGPERQIGMTRAGAPAGDERRSRSRRDGQTHGRSPSFAFVACLLRHGSRSPAATIRPAAARTPTAPARRASAGPRRCAGRLQRHHRRYGLWRRQALRRAACAPSSRPTG